MGYLISQVTNWLKHTIINSENHPTFTGPIRGNGSGIINVNNIRQTAICWPLVVGESHLMCCTGNGHILIMIRSGNNVRTHKMKKVNLWWPLVVGTGNILLICLDTKVGISISYNWESNFVNSPAEESSWEWDWKNEHWYVAFYKTALGIQHVELDICCHILSFICWFWSMGTFH